MYHYLVATTVNYPHLVVDNQGIAFILLDSMQAEIRGTEIWGAEGKLGDEQRSLLSGLLIGIRQHYPNVKKIVVALHHHPFCLDIPWPGPDYPMATLLRLRDAEGLLDVVRANENGPKIDALVFGHAHYEKRMSSKELKYGIGLIFGAGKTTEYDRKGKMKFSVHDLSSTQATVKDYFV